MASRISELILQARDPEALAAFWCAVLDFGIIDREGPDVVIGPPDGFGGLQPTLILALTESPDPVNLRLHLDVSPVDRTQEAELGRLLALGARHADVGQTGAEPWHVLADPEGNTFCLLRDRLGGQG
ncbi:VOC family protein [Kribbella sandramycini]|uniref:Catechol 2,3-dioxygenase-like lactoylglutathione lyase family enzyme n=1 Tax=Kribbella sandramycini TaxID=60450 RepID=A0A7Y4NY35_9ACTN|nr:VOC family protein [Kribbella sandramycini]MBB6567983.1 catechol 2,3-dioxygenase-like lactoylglutathione lyase family enzyme [Kribbella sandramycini]NOL39423.1 VOC family protein [Kribbella sandramycini]